ncbi:ArnT family glycosyltransferase [Celerinatantimonas yamalensis]|uniref:Glycosyltransferase family 39 protein n=1 Tax=Celerinatantimonas yamalensis TaxID=559956 RepID=A0ABW9G6F1_9GAMM
MKSDMSTFALKQPNDQPNKWLIALLVALFICRLWTLGPLHLALFYDEAYYHFWATHLDFGYYSKPPLVAWLIALSTGIFGHSHEWAVRLTSPLLYAGAAFFVYRLGKTLYNSQVGLWAALIFYSSPLVTFNSIFITTDAPLLFFWALTSWLFVCALRTQKLSWWTLCGLSAGLGLLSKYTMAVLILGLAVYFILQKAYPRAGKGPWIALLLALAVFSPNLWWNAQYGFISFVHTAQISKLEEQLFHFNKFFEFLGSQFLVFGPIAMALLFAYSLRLKREKDGLLLFAISWPLLLVMFVQAFLSHANANWAAPVYLGASLIVAAGLVRHQANKLIGTLVGINIALAVLLFSYPSIQRALSIQPSSHNTPYRRVLGWRELMTNIKEKYPQASQMNWISGSRMLLSYANYYLSDWPHHQAVKVFSFNPSRQIDDQFELRYDVANSHQTNFVFITQIPRQLQGCFKTSKLLGKVGQTTYPLLKRTVYLYQVTGFQGYEHCH